MQEKINHVTERKHHRRYTTKEERLAHVKKWQESELPVTDYCRQEGIPLTSFLGWRRTAMKPVPIFKPLTSASPMPVPKVNSGNVIEILAESGIKIRLLNVTDASLAVNIARGLIKCS